jgi:C1A family cysteine protease
MENYLKLRFKKSPIDENDLIYRSDNTKCIREIVDLRSWDTMIESQGSLGSCTGSAITSAYELMVKQSYPDQYVELSDLFIYYNARLEENTLNQDVGIFVKTGMEVLKNYGVCAETLWPYNIEMWDDKPPDTAYEDAKKRKILKYQKITSIYYMTEVLSDNRPIVFGMEIYDSFMYLDEHISTVPFPSRKEKSLGGHAMCIVGYDLQKRLFLTKNSFGTNWGMSGYCWVPFDYIKEEGYDMWIFDIPPQTGEPNVLSETLPLLPLLS